MGVARVLGPAIYNYWFFINYEGLKNDEMSSKVLFCSKNFVIFSTWNIFALIQHISWIFVILPAFCWLDWFSWFFNLIGLAICKNEKQEDLIWINQKKLWGKSAASIYIGRFNPCNFNCGGSWFSWNN